MLKPHPLIIGNLLTFSLNACGGKEDHAASDAGGAPQISGHGGQSALATTIVPSLGGGIADTAGYGPSSGTGSQSGTSGSGSMGGSFATQGGSAGSLPARCALPVLIGTGNGSILDGWAYGYNAQTQRCERFHFTDAGLNDNRFEQLEDCIAACDPGGLDACAGSADCALGAPGCCGSCEPHEKSDFVAVNAKYASINRCTQSVSCGPCPIYEGTPTVQYFGAQCVQGHCQVTDSREAQPTPCNPDALAAGNAQSTYTLELARAAQPGTPIELIILLSDPGSFTGKTVEERKAELAPSQAPIVAALEARGATNIEQFWLINSISATLLAKDVSETLCWPAVVSIESESLYWDVVDRPWDLASVGSSECPLNGGQCPIHCRLMRAEPCDPILDCLRASEPIACSVNEFGGLGGGCAANEKTGQMYCNVLEFIPREPWYLGWRDCTAEEQQRCGRAMNKYCP